MRRPRPSPTTPEEWIARLHGLAASFDRLMVECIRLEEPVQKALPGWLEGPDRAALLYAVAEAAVQLNGARRLTRWFQRNLETTCGALRATKQAGDDAWLRAQLRGLEPGDPR